MTRDDTKQLIRMLMATYSNFKPENVSETVDAWAFILEEYPRELVGNAFKEYVKTTRTGFAPSVNDLIDIISKPVDDVFLNEVEAWALVSNAIRRSAYYAEEEFKKLPEPVQKALGSPTMLRAWALDGEFNEDVAMSNFSRTYKQIVIRDKERIKCNTNEVLRICEEDNNRRLNGENMYCLQQKVQDQE